MSPKRWTLRVCLLAVMGAGCSSQPRNIGTGSSVVKETVVSRVRLVGYAGAPESATSAAALQRKRDRLRAEGIRRGTASVRALFFHTFSETVLRFVEARLLPPPARVVKRQGQWKVLRRWRVRRTPEAVRILSLEARIAPHEAGLCGLRIGDDAKALRRRFGAPEATGYPAAVGCVQRRWGGLSVWSCLDRIEGLRLRPGASCPQVLER